MFVQKIGKRTIPLLKDKKKLLPGENGCTLSIRTLMDKLMKNTDYTQLSFFFLAGEGNNGLFFSNK